MPSKNMVRVAVWALLTAMGIAGCRNGAGEEQRTTTATVPPPNQYPGMPAMCTPGEVLACQNLREVVLGQAIYNEGVAWPRDLIRRGGSDINSVNGNGVGYAEVRSTADHCNIAFVVRGSQPTGNDWGANVDVGDRNGLPSSLGGAYRPPTTSTDPFDQFWLANTTNVGFHHGHFGAARALAADPVIATLASEIAACQPGPARVHVTGHSLGAGITVYLYPYLASRYAPAQFSASASGPPRSFNPGLFITLPLAAPAGWPTAILGPFLSGGQLFVSNTQIAQLHAVSPLPAAVLAMLGGPPASGVPYSINMPPITLHIGAQDPLASGWRIGLPVGNHGLPPAELGWIHSPGTVVNTSASHTEDRCVTISGLLTLVSPFGPGTVACPWHSGYVYSAYEACATAIRDCSARNGDGGHTRVTAPILGQVYRYLPGGSRTIPTGPVTVNACQPEPQIGVDCWRVVGERDSGYRRIYDRRSWSCREVLTETSTNKGIGPGWEIAVATCSRMLQDCGEQTRMASASCPGGAPAPGAPQQVVANLARALADVESTVPAAAPVCGAGCAAHADVDSTDAVTCVEVGAEVAEGIRCVAPNEVALVDCAPGEARDLDNGCVPAGETCPVMGGVSTDGYCHFEGEEPTDETPAPSEGI